MLKRIGLIAAWLVLAAALMPASAQPPARDWLAWLFNPADGTITQVSSSGDTLEPIYLPLSQAFNAYGDRVSASANGRYVAYTAFDSTLGPAISNRQYFVYDRTIDSTRFTFPLEGIDALDLEIHASPTAFDEMRQQFAFGFAKADSWQIVAASLINGTVIATLDSASAASITEGGMPVVMHFDANVVHFLMVENGTAGGAYRWDIAADALTAEGLVTSLQSDVLPATTEIVTPSANTLNITSTDGTFAFYTHSAAITEAHFIADGLQVLAETSKDAQPLLLVLNRDGSIAAEILGALESIRGTPTGFAGMFAANSGSALARVDTVSQDFALKAIWSGGADVQLVHIFGLGGNAPTGFPAWAGAE